MLLLAKIKARLNRLYRTYVEKDPVLVATKNWFRDKGDATLRLDYDLDETSIVIDVGGYHGDWAAMIWERYRPTIYIFEPMPEFLAILRDRFKDNPKITIFPYGLSDQDHEVKMAPLANGSSIYHDADNAIAIPLRDITTVQQNLGLSQIDLIKINIEGGEFPLLSKIISSGLIRQCIDIQVQFHTFYPDAFPLRELLRQKLSLTHALTYDYTFVWENWRRLSASERQSRNSAVSVAAA